MARISWWGVLFFVLTLTAVFAAEPYTIVPAPDWADPLPVTEPPKVPVDQIRDGVYYLMIDKFARVAEQEVYGQYARKIVTEAGVQTGSEIRIDLDPSHETIELHSVDVLRDGVWQHRLTPKLVDVLKREEGMDDYIVDGNLTLVVRLPDIRPGDIIRYDFTRRGANPVMKGHFYQSFAVGFSQPFETIRQRVLSDPARPLTTRGHATTLEPVVSGNLLTWRIDHPEIIVAEDDIPAHVTVYPWIEMSDMRDWSDVVAWARPLYDLDQPLPVDLLERISSLGGDAMGKVSAALRWVQDDVRYLGVEGGIFSHQPRAPSLVYEQRSGDCKEKVLLLVSILKRLGIAANPVLVNSGWGKGIGDFLPSPYAFDHVIVEAVIGGERYFLDPTRTSQRGPLWQIYVPDYGLGLRIAADVTGLTPVHPREASFGKTSVVETLKVPAPSNAEPATLEVDTVATGLAAENLRSDFASDGTDGIRENYLDFYAEKYPRIESAGPITTADEPATNTFRVSEKYRIPGFWEKGRKGGRVGKISAKELTGRLNWPDRSTRRWPFAIKFPSSLEFTTHVTLPEEWPDASDTDETSNPWFKFSYYSRSSGASLTLGGAYEALAAEVPADRVAEYRSEVEGAAAEAGYQLTHGSVPAAKNSWPVQILFILVIALAALLAVLCAGYLLIPRRGPPALPAHPSIAHLDGLGGWLVLVGFGLVISPFTMAAGLTQTFTPILQGDVWANLNPAGDGSHRLLWLAILLFESFFNTVFVVLRIGLIPLFFLKRRSFPSVFNAISISQTAFLILDAVVAGLLLHSPSDGGEQSSATVAFQSLIGTLVWVAYMLKSQRVKATFRR